MCLVMSADKDYIYDTETIDEGRQLWSEAEAKILSHVLGIKSQEMLIM